MALLDLKLKMSDYESYSFHKERMSVGTKLQSARFQVQFPAKETQKEKDQRPLVFFFRNDKFQKTYFPAAISVNASPNLRISSIVL